MTERDPVDRAPLECEFIERLRKALERGAREYGDQSFFDPLSATQEELEAEAIDIAGWGFVLWAQLRLRATRLVEALEPGPAAQVFRGRSLPEDEATITRLHKALAFAASCIKSGERWSGVCEDVIGGALERSRPSPRPATSRLPPSEPERDV